mmetsp:Transcript_46084/g.111636  ORF Transcript_46084/g.111636 Transcript_46084/m.111636 type:complete len:205 (+) Transcript_46084:4073-4687(+)
MSWSFCQTAPALLVAIKASVASLVGLLSSSSSLSPLSSSLDSWSLASAFAFCPSSLSSLSLPTSFCSTFCGGVAASSLSSLSLSASLSCSTVFGGVVETTVAAAGGSVSIADLGFRILSVGASDDCSKVLATGVETRGASLIKWSSVMMTLLECITNGPETESTRNPSRSQRTKEPLVFPAPVGLPPLMGAFLRGVEGMICQIC